MIASFDNDSEDDVLKELKKWEVMDSWDWSKAEFPNCYGYGVENLNGERVAKSGNNTKLLYDHTKFNETIEIVIKMIDRLDRFDRIFAQ